MQACLSSCDECGQVTRVLRCDILSYTETFLSFAEHRKRGYYCPSCVRRLSQQAVTRTEKEGGLFVSKLLSLLPVRMNDWIIRRRLRILESLREDELLAKRRKTFRQRSLLPHPMYMLLTIAVLVFYAAYVLWGSFNARR